MNSSFHFPNFLQAYMRAEADYQGPLHYGEPFLHDQDTGPSSDSPLEQINSAPTSTFPSAVSVHTASLPLNTVVA